MITYLRGYDNTTWKYHQVIDNENTRPINQHALKDVLMETLPHFQTVICQTVQGFIHGAYFIKNGSCDTLIPVSIEFSAPICV